MRYLLLIPLLTAICAAQAAETGALVHLDFNDGVMPTGIHDNTYKGDKPVLQVVGAANPTRGKELSVQVAPGGFAQIILGKVTVEAGCIYVGSITLSALADAEVKFYLRMGDKPYTILLPSTAKVGTAPAVYTLSGVPKQACDSAYLMIYTDAQTTLRVDDVRLVKQAP
jgi:hypothetical protein